MSTTQSLRPVFAALAIAGAALLGVTAHAQTELPIHDANGVLYVSGGVGQDESKLLRRVQSQWPASFEFAARAGQKSDFVAGVLVSVFDTQGRPVLDQVVSDGPIMLAGLQPGHYRVQATLDSRILSREIDVPASGTAHNLFLWPEGTDMSDGTS